MSATISCDLAIVGGGLAGGLIARAVHQRHPDAQIRLIEGGAHLGGNHLWSFFASDVAPADRWLVSPLISHGWTRYDVAFPGHARTLKSPYYSIESRRFEREMLAALPAQAILRKRRVIEVNSTQVLLADGDRVEAQGVIDCRGTGDLSALELGWQKFLGRELALTRPHDLERPVVMDATVEQQDGYRFVYCLPFAPDRIFVEDTYYSDDRTVDAGTLGSRIDAYVAARGWQVASTAREESGALPVAIGGDFEAYWRSGGTGIAKAGVRAGLFHPLTSYSLPDAVRTAALIADAGTFEGAALHDLLHRHASRTWRSRRFYRLLAAMLFKAAEPEERYRILARFYRLDEGLIRRFYAANSNLGDKIRVMTGKPPVPIGRAVRAITGVV
ncbi:lycopene beta-cyclase CrtY [Sphingomonas psychrotolerans]|uniref:Lycopene beta-cyclase CrtY n=1 Tax=Sphingomonas psychrotolerans TaxID=1327635 RepID=A0ABU3N774_9SPHN|nr:lycopene beta-cyclase CrtY [Sphingomonas psychrotolerans]MDT8760375.1 lycopene beta-cyclase CrtY [Sphingomonas psychrotolerans]